VRPSSATGGRFYFGFDADASGCRSFVMAPNSSDIRFQNNLGYAYEELTTTTQDFIADHWYLLEVEILSSSTAIGRLYDSDGATLLASVTEDFGAIGAGGVALRSFGGMAADTITICR
jgi:hypothetical protein